MMCAMDVTKASDERNGNTKDNADTICVRVQLLGRWIDEELGLLAMLGALGLSNIKSTVMARMIELCGQIPPA